MKLCYYSIVFALIFMSFQFVNHLSDREQNVLYTQKRRLDIGIQDAVDHAVQAMVTSPQSQYLVHKEAGAKVFFRSMYAALGIMDSIVNQELFQSYVPILVVTQQDGFYIMYTAEYVDSKGMKHMTKCWSERLPYVSEDKDFIYHFTFNDELTIYDKMNLLENEEDVRTYTLNYQQVKNDSRYQLLAKKRAEHFMLQTETFTNMRNHIIVSLLEENIRYYLNEHNRIAKHYGIIYDFTMPETDASEWTRSMDGPGMMVFIQGYPYEGSTKRYQRFCFAGAKITKQLMLYLEERNDHTWIYHRENCKVFKSGNRVKVCESPYIAAQNGAFACEECNKE